VLARPKSVSASANSTTQSLPQSGDVVVVQESHSDGRYTVRQLPATVQRLISSSRDEAVRIARGFAQKHAVDLWYSEDGTHRLLEVYRPVTSRGIPN
jgi:hypothetical protein